MRADEEENISDQRTIILENVTPIEKGDFTDLSKQSRAHSSYAALENVMQILGEPFDYNLLMGLSGHAFRLMIYKGGLYIEPPYDGEGYYFDHHTLPAIGYEQRMGCDVHENCGYSPEDIAQAIRESLNHGLPVLVQYPFPHWGVSVGYESARHIVNTYDGEMAKLDEITGFRILGKNSLVQLAESIFRSFQIVTDYAFRERMPKDDKKWFGKYSSGIAAYGTWISHLKANRVKDEFANWWNYGALLDARRAAVDYLTQAKQFYAGAPLEQLEELIAKYENLVSFLHKNLEHFPRREDVSQFTVGAVATLEAVREMEKDAFTFIKNSNLANL